MLPDASPQQDGVSNLLKYALNLSFYSPDYRILAAGSLRGLPRIDALPNGSSSLFRYEFLRRKGSGLIYTPQIDALRFPSGCLRQSVSLRSADELPLLIVEVTPSSTLQRSRVRLLPSNLANLRAV